MKISNYKLIAVTKKIFRAYDIRGEVGADLSEDAYYTIGKSFATFLLAAGRNKLYLGWDGRLTSVAFAKAITQGLVTSGIEVHQIGQVPTPILYFATHINSEIDSGLIVTGSHNPASHNGIKMVVAGKTLVQQDIDELYNNIISNKFTTGLGEVVFQNVTSLYIKDIVARINLKRNFKIVVDAGNGVVGPTALEVFKKLGCEVIPLYCEVDGNFPNHHPDPSVAENLQDLQVHVVSTQAELGIAFDGDADRLGVVTNTGKIIWPDRLMMYYAKKLLPTRNNAPIAFDVKCSKYLKQVIETSGGVAHMCPTGHSIVKGFMKQHEAILAGEMSGHIFFQDGWYGFDDALYAACRLLEFLSDSDETLEQQFASIPDSVNTPEIKINIADEHKFNFMESLRQHAKFDDGELITIDGIRVEYTNGWGLIRASNTTPCLVARFEADDAAALQYIQEKFKEQLLLIQNKVALKLDLPF